MAQLATKASQSRHAYRNRSYIIYIAYYCATGMIYSEITSNRCNFIWLCIRSVYGAIFLEQNCERPCEKCHCNRESGYRDPNGVNMCLFSAETCTSQCNLRSCRRAFAKVHKLHCDLHVVAEHITAIWDSRHVLDHAIAAIQKSRFDDTHYADLPDGVTLP